MAASTSARIVRYAVATSASAGVRLAAAGHGAARRPAGGGAGHEVAEVVGQVGVEPPDQRLLREVGVEAEHGLAHDEVPEGVVAIGVGQGQGLDDVADGLRHLAAAHPPEAVHVEARVDGQARRLEHAGPVDPVRLQDVLADQVLDVRPEGRVLLAADLAEGRDVVDEGVEPHVGHEAVVEGQRDPPLKPRARAADAQVLQRLAQEAEDLVAIALGPDEVRMRRDVLDQPVLVGRHPEEVVLLLDPGQGRVVVGALAVHDLLVGVEALAAVAVVAAVLAEVDLAGLPQLSGGSAGRCGRAGARWCG